MKMKHRFLMAPADGTQGGAGGGTAPVADPNAPTSAGADPNAAGDGRTSAQAGEQTNLLAQNQGTDWLPEKFRVNGVDGKLDTEASARKLATSYSELEKTRPTGTLPKDSESYELKDLPEGMKIEDLKADPLYQGFLKGAHAKGMTNEQVGYVLNQYAKLVPDLLAADTQVGAAEAKAELAKVWGDDKAVGQNLALAARAVRGFGVDGEKPGSVDRLMAKYGNDPDFLAFAAAIGKEMAEDTPIQEGSQGASDWDAQVAKIKSNPAYTNPDHPEHEVLVGQLSQLYARRYGNKPQQLTGAVVR